MTRNNAFRKNLHINLVFTEQEIPYIFCDVNGAFYYDYPTKFTKSTQSQPCVHLLRSLTVSGRQA